MQALADNYDKAVVEVCLSTSFCLQSCLLFNLHCMCRTKGVLHKHLQVVQGACLSLASSGKLPMLRHNMDAWKGRQKGTVSLKHVTTVSRQMHTSQSPSYEYMLWLGQHDSMQLQACMGLRQLQPCSSYALQRGRPKHCVQPRHARKWRIGCISCLACRSKSSALRSGWLQMWERWMPRSI